MVTKVEIKSLNVNPGDTLVLTSHNQITAEQATELKQAFARELPDVRVIIVSGLQVAAVYREIGP